MIMDRRTAKAAVTLLLIYALSISLCSTVEDGNNICKDHLLAGQQVEDKDHSQLPLRQMAEPPTAIVDRPPSTIIDAAKILFSLPNSRLALLRAAASNYWNYKLKTLLLFEHDQDHFSPAPALETENNQVEAGADGAGEKVKEAIAKSLDKSKVAVEDSARSAAKLAGDAMEETAKKVKKTLSDTSAPSEAEL